MVHDFIKYINKLKQNIEGFNFEMASDRPFANQQDRELRS